MDVLGRITMHNADCMDLLRQMPDKSYDLAIVDPPYGIGGDSLHAGRSNKRNRMRGAGVLRDRILNTAKTDWDIAPTKEYFDELLRVSKNAIIWGGNYFGLPRCRCFICWDKVQPWPNFSQCEYAWTTFDQPAKLFKYDNRTGGKIHPTQKPVELYKWLLDRFAKVGDRILDTHIGSASIAIACHDMGLELTGIEIDKEFYDKAVERIREHQRQLMMEF